MASQGTGSAATCAHVCDALVTDSVPATRHLLPTIGGCMMPVQGSAPSSAAAADYQRKVQSLEQAAMVGSVVGSSASPAATGTGGAGATGRARQHVLSLAKCPD
jgi:hypothetical protein